MPSIILIFVLWRSQQPELPWSLLSRERAHKLEVRHQRPEGTHSVQSSVLRLVPAIAVSSKNKDQMTWIALVITSYF